MKNNSNKKVVGYFRNIGVTTELIYLIITIELMYLAARFLA